MIKSTSLFLLRLLAVWLAGAAAVLLLFWPALVWPDRPEYVGYWIGGLCAGVLSVVLALMFGKDPVI